MSQGIKKHPLITGNGIKFYFKAFFGNCSWFKIQNSHSYTWDYF